MCLVACRTCHYAKRIQKRQLLFQRKNIRFKTKGPFST